MLSILSVCSVCFVFMLWFSINISIFAGAVLSPRGHLAMSVHILGCSSWGAASGIQRVGAGVC